MLYGKLLVSCLSALLLGLSFTPQAPAQTIQQRFGFACNSQSVCSNGKVPNSLLQSADGNSYSTTVAGGIGNQASGTVFQINPAGQLKVPPSPSAQNHGLSCDGIQVFELSRQNG